jgi:hypothetical protein
MNWLPRIHTAAKLLGASYQIVMAGLTIFYTIRMTIRWDQPKYDQHQYFRRSSHETQPKLRTFKGRRSFRRKN